MKKLLKIYSYITFATAILGVITTIIHPSIDALKIVSIGGWVLSFSSTLIVFILGKDAKE